MANKQKVGEPTVEPAFEPSEVQEESLVKVAEVEEKPTAVSIYTAEELADNYKLFNASREIVVVALRLAGKKSATFQEAERIIEKFKNKEVN